MREAQDILIRAVVEVGKAIGDLQNLEKSITTTASSMGGKMSSAVTGMGAKVTNAGNRISEAGKKIKSALGTEAALAFTAAGTAATNFAKQCISSAVKSESEWTRFGALVQSSGGSWTAEAQKDIKGWAKTFSNNMGYAVSDTREASMALMQFGVKSSQLESSMRGVAAVAARTGMTEAEASNMVISALNGRGMQLAKLTGLRIEDYKTADGQIDQERLLNDLYEQNKDALEAHSKTTEAAIQRMNNSWGSFKTSIGQALLPVVNIIADVVGAIAKWFADLPGPAKTFIAVLLVLGGVIGTVIGVLGLIAPALISLGGIIAAIGSAGGVVAYLAPAFAGLTTIFGGFLGVLSSLLLPILAVVAALGALYFVGLEMGWWNDLSGMVAKFGEVLGQVIGVIGNFINWFILLFTDFPKAQQMFSDFINSLPGIVMGALGALGEWIGQALGNAWNSLSSAGWGLIEAVGQMFSNAITGIVSYAQDFGSQIISTITDALSNLGSMVVPGGGLVEGILSIIAPIPMLLYGKIVEFGPQVLPAINQFVTDLVNGFNEQLNGLGEWIAQSLSNIPGIVSDTLSGLGGAISGALSGLGSSILSGIGGAISAVRDGLLMVMDGLVSALSGLGNLPVVGPLFDGLAKSIQYAASMISIFSNAAIGIINVFTGLLSGTMSVGDAFNAIGGIISIALGQVQVLVANFVTTIISNFMGIGNRILQGFLNIPAMLAQFFTLAVQQIQMKLAQARMIAGLLVTMLVQSISIRFNMLVARVRMIFTSIVNAIRSRLANARGIASNLANMIRNAIVTRFNLIIARVRSIFQRIVSTIRQRLSNAVSSAKQKAQEILQGIKDKVSQIPQMVADEFNKIKDKISSALDNAKNVAVQKIGDLVAAVKGALGIASPGFIQRMVTWEFNSIPGIISDNGVLAVKEAGKMASGIVDAWTSNTSDLIMPGLSMTGSDFSSLLHNQSIDLLRGNPMIQQDLSLLTSNMKVPTMQGAGSREIINNTTHTTDDHQTHIHIDKIELDCNNLTKQESRQILYNALDGLYTGGI